MTKKSFFVIAVFSFSTFQTIRPDLSIFNESLNL